MNGLSLLLRFFSLVLIILALSEPVIQFKKKINRVLWCVDRSESIPEKEKSWLYGLLKNKNEKVIFFDNDAHVKAHLFSAQDLKSSFVSLTKSMPALDKLGCFTNDYGYNVVMFTDGNFIDQDEFLSEMVFLSSKNIVFNFFPLSTSIKADLALGEADVSENYVVKIPFWVAGGYIKGVISIENSVGEILGKSLVDIKSANYGEAVFKLNQPNKPIEEYKAIFLPDSDDDFLMNNKISFFMKNKNKNRILRLASKNNNVLLTELLKGRFDIVDASADDEINSYLKVLGEFRLIILDDLPAYRLSEEQMSNIEAAVKEDGLGLIMCGLHNSFGLGGYKNTPIEKALPVKMYPGDPNSEEDFIILLDKSGSMAEGDGTANTRLFFAVNASVSLLKQLDENDRFGVIAFDTAAYDLIPLNKKQDFDLVEKILLRVGAHGGTDLSPVIEKAIGVAKENPTRNARFILLSDGNTQNQQRCLNLIEKFKKTGKTLSVIGIGESVNEEFINQIGQITRSRVYFIKNARNLTRIFTREKELAENQNIINAPSSVIFYGDKEIYNHNKSINIPDILKYVRIGIKPEARAPVKSVDGDCLIGVWRYGVGKTAVLASDIESSSLDNWVKSGIYPDLIYPLFEYCCNKSNDLNLNGLLDVKLGFFKCFLSSSIKPEFCTVSYPDGLNLELDFIRSVNGFVSDFKLNSEGTYKIRAVFSDGKSVDLNKFISYPIEYRKVGVNYNFISTASANSGGKVFLDSSQLKKFKPVLYVKKMFNCYNTFIILSISVFIIELAYRKRLNLREIYHRFRDDGWRSLFNN